MKKFIVYCIFFILLFSGCSNSGIEPVNLFRSEFDPNMKSAACRIEITKGEVVKGKALPILNLEGKYPENCGQVQVGVNPPNAKGEINIVLFSTVTTGNESPSDTSKPFYLTVTLTNLWNAHFYVFVNGNKVTDFSLP